MAIEAATYISDLNSANPLGTDQRSTVDDHLRLIKSTVKATLPNLTGPVTPTHTELNYMGGVTSPVQTQLNTKPTRATRIDVASAAGAVDLTTNAPSTDDIRITGALAITAFTVITDRVLRVTAGGAFTLTNNASIVTNTGANIVCASGDTFMLRATAANTVEVLGYTTSAGKRLAQIQTTAISAAASGTTVLPGDDTIPQNTEGDQYLSQAITPTNVNSTLEITVTLVNTASIVERFTIALFQDASANALAAVMNDASTYIKTTTFTHYMTSGTLSATTFKVRAGLASAGTTYINGTSGGRAMGGVMASRITVKEYLP